MDVSTLKCLWMESGFRHSWQMFSMCQNLGVNLFSLIIAEMKGYCICAENSQVKLIWDDIIVGTGVHEGKSLYTRNPAIAEGPRDAGVPVEIW